jgi:hypothetical protein
MIYVECKPDQTLVQVVTGLSIRQVTHEFKGKGEVMNQLARTTNSVGLVDEDPGKTQPRSLMAMRMVQELSERGLLLRQDSRGNRLVLLRPRLEEWVVVAARDARVPPHQFNLPDDPRRLHAVINLELRQFENLVQALSSTPRLTALRQLLRS